MISSDGINWTFGNLPAFQFFCIRWIQKLKIFICLGYSISIQQCIISSDGLNWYNTNTLNTPNVFRSLAWSPELETFCAVGRSNTPNVPAIYIGKLIP